jgi:hypothetical protein
MARPRCAYCDKLAPKLTTTVWVGSFTDSSRQKNGDWYRHIYLDEPLRSIADCRWHTNQQVVSVHYGMNNTISRFSEWDGESYWLKYGGQFCSTPCAIKFAKAAHKAGYRMVKEEA